MKAINGVILTVSVLCLGAGFCVGLEQQRPINECDSYREEFVACSRTLPNGEVQGGTGACVCKHHKWEGGCMIPETDYTEYKETVLESCERTCHLGRVVKGCGEIEAMAEEEEPVCGEWVCKENNIKPFSECVAGEVKYTPDECSYSTQVCCSDGKWSEADTPCK